MAEVDILLASYNGEKFIAEQINSLLAQTYKDFRIIIRDDGSSDNTPAIIEEYAKKYPAVIEIIHDDAICRNPTKNFFQLMKYARAPYVMFCDQDDYWKPEKIQIMLEAMKKTESENPNCAVLIFSGLDIGDENLNITKNFTPQEFSDTKNFCSLFLYNFVTGCAEIVNKKIYENIGEYSEVIDYHDHWTALYACACGVIANVPRSLMIYRNHSEHFTGKIRNRHTLEDIIKTPAKKLRKSRETFLILKKRFEIFTSRYSRDIINQESERDLKIYADIFGKNIFKKFSALKKLFHRVNLERSQKFLWLVRIIFF